MPITISMTLFAVSAIYLTILYEKERKKRRRRGKKVTIRYQIFQE